MSPSKLLAQCCHVAANLGIIPQRVVVLKASDIKFYEKIEELKSISQKYYLQTDAGITELPPNTDTVVGWIE